MTKQKPQCSRCGHFLARPLDQNANYVTHSDFVEQEEEVYYVGLRHTEKTRKRVNNLMRVFPKSTFEELSAAIAHPDADDTIQYTWGKKWVEQEGGITQTAASYDHPFGLKRGDFEPIEVETPRAVHREEIAHVEEHTRPVEVQKTGLICPDCVKEDDEIIWGINK